MISISTDQQTQQHGSTASASSSAVLALERVTRQYDRSQAPAVCHVSLTLHNGELLGLLGPSGCGKTTLLRLIAGFERPQSGTIYLGRQVVAGHSWVPPEKRGIGMVFQDYALFPHLTVGKNVAFGLRQTRFTQAGRSLNVRQRVHEILDLVGLAGLERRFPHQLSGGQQQRVALARALAPFPQMVLLDEPLSNLDAKVRLQLRQEVRDIIKSAGASGIFVTHDQEEALSICDRVAVMRAGHIEQLGSPETLYQRPASRFVAEFVTQANFIAATWHENRLTTDWCDISLDRAEWQARNRQYHVDGDEQVLPIRRCDAKVLEIDPAIELPADFMPQPGALVDIMVRQEDIVLEPDAKSAVTIRDRQFLGRENRYTLQAPSGKVLVARTDAKLMLPVGTAVGVAIANSAVRLFPPQHSSNHAAPAST